MSQARDVVRNQHQADRQQPDADDRQKPEQAADEAEDPQGQPMPALRRVARPADRPAEAGSLLQSIEGAIEQVAGVVVTIVDHTDQALLTSRCSGGVDCQLAADCIFIRSMDTHRGRNLTYGMLDALGRSIVIGSYDQRAFPTEAELAKLHAVSRSVIREAVKMLTAKGLLSARPRRGTVVEPSSNWNLFDTDVLRWLLERKFSVELLKQFNQLRVAIEPEAAALAAQYADAKEREAISAGLARMEAAEQGLDDTLDADIAFHVAILKASKNPFYAQFEDVVSTALHSSIQFTNRIKGRSASVSAHAAVRDAIMKRSPDKARAAMRNIISDVLELIDTAGDAAKKPAKSQR